MSTHYLVGHPGTGKTTRLVQEFTAPLDAGVRPDRILVLVPQESGARRFQAALTAPRRRVTPHIETFAGLIQRYVGLFFPRIAPQAGFGAHIREPARVNVESAQYLLDQLIAPYLDRFSDLRVSRARPVIQVLDNLNRAALSSFPLQTLAERLSAAWRGEASRHRAYSAAQEVALAFRQFCLAHGLVDFSLSIELFRAHLLSADFYRAYVAAQYRHIFADNIEEGAPVIHDFLTLLLETAESAWLVEDDPGGYRLNLGAEPASARMLRAPCAHVVHVQDARLAANAPPSPAHFAQALMAAITARQQPTHALAAEVTHLRYWVNMIEATVTRIAELVAQGTPANAIAVIAPVVEDVLQFELAERLRAHQSDRLAHPAAFAPAHRSAARPRPAYFGPPGASGVGQSSHPAGGGTRASEHNRWPGRAARTAHRRGQPAVSLCWPRANCRFRAMGAHWQCILCALRSTLQLAGHSRALRPPARPVLDTATSRGAQPGRLCAGRGC